MFKCGNYVNWMEDYDDGIAGKDYGDGIIIDIQTYQSPWYNNSLTTYKVFRNKHKDFYWFEERQLKLKEIQ